VNVLRHERSGMEKEVDQTRGNVTHGISTCQEIPFSIPLTGCVDSSAIRRSGRPYLANNPLCHFLLYGRNEDCLDIAPPYFHGVHLMSGYSVKYFSFLERPSLFALKKFRGMLVAGQKIAPEADVRRMVREKILSGGENLNFYSFVLGNTSVDVGDYHYNNYFSGPVVSSNPARDLDRALANIDDKFLFVGVGDRFLETLIAFVVAMGGTHVPEIYYRDDPSDEPLEELEDLFSEGPNRMSREDLFDLFERRLEQDRRLYEHCKQQIAEHVSQYDLTYLRETYEAGRCAEKTVNVDANPWMDPYEARPPTVPVESAELASALEQDLSALRRVNELLEQGVVPAGDILEKAMKSLVARNELLEEKIRNWNGVEAVSLCSKSDGGNGQP